MKKFIAITLIAVMLMGLAGCGAINDTDVAILWSGDGVVRVPNSLINTMERAMYIENISYAHHGANGDQAVQTAQVNEALNSGCSALMVELVDPAAAQEILDAAKAKNIPVVFFNCDVEETVISGYDKCALVSTDLNTQPVVYAELICATLLKETKNRSTKEITYTLAKDADRNEDGIITYFAVGDVSATVAAINGKLSDAGLPALVEAGNADSGEAVAALAASDYTNTANKEIGLLSSEGTSIDLILTADDAAAQDVLVALQEKGYNKDRLTTHCIPVYTVGNTADYKSLVLAGRPQGGHKDNNVQEYFKSMQHIVDLRNVEEEDLDVMLYTTGDVIGDGRLAGAVVEDYDAISVSAAALLAKLLKGEAIETQTVSIVYTTIEP